MSFVCIAVIGDAFAQDDQSAEPAVSVKLSSNKATYLLGEPVVLSVVVTNISDYALKMRKVYSGSNNSQISIYVADKNSFFKRWSVSPHHVLDVEPSIQVLKPSDKRHYTERILRDEDRANNLAFPQPGSYRAKVRFPFHSPGKPVANEIESNVVSFDVTEPQSTAKKLRSHLRGDPLLVFMEQGNAKKDVVLEAARLMQIFPTTPYFQFCTFRGSSRERCEVAERRDFIIALPAVERHPR